MPGLDYRRLRTEISIEQVLHLLRFQPARRRGPALRGPCPIHNPRSQQDRTDFSVNLQQNIFQCFRCGAHGNQLDLWHQVCKLPFHTACLDLCQQLNIEPPWLAPPAPTRTSDFRNLPPQTPRRATI